MVVRLAGRASPEPKAASLDGFASDGGFMANAKELLLSFISADPGQAGALFAEEGVLEVPYLTSIGVRARYCGPKDVEAFLRLLHGKVYPGAVFENVSIHIETPNQVFGEYHITAKSRVSGNTVHQQFLGHLVVGEREDQAAARSDRYGGGRRGDVLARTRRLRTRERRLAAGLTACNGALTARRGSWNVACRTSWRRGTSSDRSACRSGPHRASTVRPAPCAATAPRPAGRPPFAAA